ncbi:MAG: hypothetical protein GTN99_02840 [Candidatus Dadabacteria bacterium]|nr:hypothetical protein [Candidatus Dadabacteria bacterium]
MKNSLVRKFRDKLACLIWGHAFHAIQFKTFVTLRCTRCSKEQVVPQRSKTQP